MNKKQAAILTKAVKSMIQEKKKPGGGLTDMGALKRINKPAWAAKIKSALRDTEGNVETASEELDVSARTLHGYIDDDSSLEKEKERSRDISDKNSNESYARSELAERVFRRLLKLCEETEKTPAALPEPPPDYAKKIAAKLASASEGGIGMLTQPYGSQGISVVLYKTNIFVGNTLASLDTETGKGGDTQTIADSAEKSVVGMITLDAAEDRCNDAMVVKYVVAKEGLGPMLYEIAMQLSPSGRIISDRAAVSDKATGIYKVLHQRGDIDKKELDDNNVPTHKRKTPDDPSDDCEVWNHKGKNPDREFLDYSFEGSGSVDIGALKKNHEESMKILNRHVQKYLGWSESFASEFLSDVASMMFMKIYHALPMATRGLKA
jgi:hypothetical protein